MARNITLTLGAGLGADLGPNFNLTANVGSVTPSTATKTELTAGKSVSVEDAATQVTVTSTGTCTNAITQTIPCGGTTTTTTTTTTAAPTTTTTTTAAPGGGTIEITNSADFGSSIDDFSPNWFIIDMGSIPITFGQQASGIHSGYTGNFGVSVSGASGKSLSLYVNSLTVETLSISSDGFYNFIGVSIGSSDFVAISLF
jgi:hypothetical protein